MATANLGRVGFVNKGTYSGATAYKVNDVVTYNTGTYACIQANTGQAPTNTSYWQNWVSDNAVHKTGDETIAGVKTFGNNTVMNGNVGVGTSSPIGKLQVKGTNPQLFLEDASGGTNGKFTAIGTNNGTMTFSRYLDNGTLDSEKMHIDASGNLLLTGGGGLGYGTGSGGTVTQLTSKSTAVTLNKPSGQITMNNASLAAGETATFQFINSTMLATDILLINAQGGASILSIYDIKAIGNYNGGLYIAVKNTSGGNLSEVIVINFAVIKGAIS